MVFSTNVADQEDTLAAQYNNLRLDVLDPTAGHNHDGTTTGGRKIDHGDLLDTNYIAGTYLTHAKITKHVQGAGTSEDPDDPGGTSGIHGLEENVHCVGSPEGAGISIQYGHGMTDSFTGGGWGDQYKIVYFEHVFSEIPEIFVCGRGGSSPHVNADQITTSQARIRLSYNTLALGTRQSSQPYAYLAIGPIDAS